MSFYRSDTVGHYTLVVPRESAWDIMNKLGQTKLAHIVPNSTPLLSKPFFAQVKRCDDSLLKIQTLQKILYDKKICEPQTQFTDEALQQLYKVWENQSTSSMHNPISLLNIIQEKVSNSWKYYHDLEQRMENLKKKIDNYRENLAIIRSGEKKFGRAFFTSSQSRMDQLGSVFMKSVSKVGFRTGIIDVADQIRFKRTIFRITKGNCLAECIHFDDIFEQLQQSEKTKMVFFVLFPAQADSLYMQKKIQRLVDMYCQQKYQLPTKYEDFQPTIRSLQDGYIQTEKLLSLTESQMQQYFHVLASPSKQIKMFKVFEYLKLYLLKQKALYQNLNEMQLYNNFLRGEIYVRKQDAPTLVQLLQAIQTNMKIPSAQMVTSESQKFPTHFVQNSYTSSAQLIIQTYGTPRYKQANPSFFATITFPFLYGVMYGDIAHGTLLFICGLYLCFKKNQIQNFVLKLFLPHRYLITLMGFFAMYCGWVYNDFLSISLNVFGSCYNPQGVPNQPMPKVSPDCVYAFGIDPAWSVAENYLDFVNSLKMKMAVIIGVVHMTLGIFVKASNTIYFGRYIEFVFQFIPQLLFMTCLFAYMDFLIFYKWFVPWDESTIPYAPSIITTMINMALHMGKTDDCCGGWPMWGTPGNTTQDHIQKVLLIVSMVCVPLMLLPKPLYQIYCTDKKPSLHSKKSLEYKKLLEGSENLVQHPQQENHGGHDDNQIFIHQLIETIEYVLGCISNTASYLRLWALSLAHSQLSQVFFDATVQGGISRGYGGIIAMILTFPIFVGITFAILLCMDSMQCFLHTLRLHWVEFQNKFYKGDGFPFVYYNFNSKIRMVLQKGSI